MSSLTGSLVIRIPLRRRNRLTEADFSEEATPDVGLNAVNRRVIQGVLGPLETGLEIVYAGAERNAR